MCVCSVEGNSSTGREFQRLMKVPVDLYEDTLTVLKLENYSKAMELFDYNGRKNLALHLVQSIVDKACVISSTEQVMEGGREGGRLMLLFLPG